MRGADAHNEALSSTVRLEEFVPSRHPLRPIRKWINEVLAKMNEKFSAMYESQVAAPPTTAQCGTQATQSARASGNASSSAPAVAS